MGVNVFCNTFMGVNVFECGTRLGVGVGCVNVFLEHVLGVNVYGRDYVSGTRLWA